MLICKANEAYFCASSKGKQITLSHQLTLLPPSHLSYFLAGTLLAAIPIMTQQPNAQRVLAHSCYIVNCSPVCLHAHVHLDTGTFLHSQLHLAKHTPAPSAPQAPCAESAPSGKQKLQAVLMSVGCCSTSLSLQAPNLG